MQAPASWSDTPRVVRESVRLIGVGMTLRYLLIWLLSYKPFADRSFDRRHRTDTDGMVPTRDLDIADEAVKWQSNLYLGSPARVTRRIIAGLDIDPRQFTFVDYGSGKGRALFVAAEYPFREVVGVEISPALHAAASSNLTRYQGGADVSKIRLWCGNALDFPLPAGNLVLHMYHPVGPDVLRQLLATICAQAGDEPRRILIPYLFSIGVAKAVFREFPQLERVRDELCVNNLYRWTLYEKSPLQAG
ncbi:MAG: class I SAM-dependent methyltransferase [Gammaproteobacteria bacterium]|jgi:SAM-dependent methyltransferase|nr:class I SAM-dependent methyltransferase [Gammaproteobacteria bacterium]